MVAAGITDIGIITGETGAEVREAVGDGVAVRRRGHLHPPGRAAGPGPLRADRPGLPRRRRLRDVPGRQHAPAGPGRVRGARSRPTGRRSAARRWTATRAAGGPDPAVPGARPAALRCGRGRRRTATWCGWSRSPRIRRANLALVGVYLFTPAIHEAVAAIEPSRPRRAGDHRRHPVADRPRSPGPPRRARGMVARHRQEGPAAREQPPGAGDARAPDRRRGRRGAPRSTGGWSWRRVRGSSTPSVRGPAIIGAGTLVERSYVGPFTAIAEDCVITDSEVEHSVVLRGADDRGCSAADRLADRP